MYIPLNYNQINIAENAFIPSMVKNRNNRTYSFWERALFQRACSTIIFDVPEEWSGSRRDFLYWVVFRCGYAVVFETPELGKVFSYGGLSGFDFYYQPTTAIIANPALKHSLELKIGTDCELIKLTPDYMGIWDIIGYYAEKLSILDNAINLSIINNKFAYILGAKNKAAAETLKKLFDRVNRGEPAVFVDSKIADDPATKDTPFQYWGREHLKESYITTDQLNDFNTLINNFDAEIGIPSLPYQKKERLVASEAESRIIDSTSRSVIWFDTLTESIDKVNKMFDLGLSVKLRYDPEEMQAESEVNDEYSDD